MAHLGASEPFSVSEEGSGELHQLVKCKAGCLPFGRQASPVLCCMQQRQECGAGSCFPSGCFGVGANEESCLHEFAVRFCISKSCTYDAVFVVRVL